MTSPAIKAANGPKEGSGKGDSPNGSQSNVNRAAEQPQEEQEQPTPPLTAWWRVFKLANLLMKQGC